MAKHISRLLPLLLFAGAQAAVELCGTIANDLTLTPDKNPYIITGPVLVKRGIFLKVEPGVEIQVSAMPACKSDSFPYPDSSNRALTPICIRGAFECVGSSKRRITIGPAAGAGQRWYGIFLDGVKGEFTRIAYTDISGALYGVRMRACSPHIRNCIFSGNQTALLCEKEAKPLVHNNLFSGNLGTGLLVRAAEPQVCGNIFLNNLIGLWSDKASKIKVEYNDFWKNPDGDFLDAPPELGVVRKKNKRGDSCDTRFNLFTDPVFFASKAHADSVEKDLKVPTDTGKADVADRKLSRIIVQTLPDSAKKGDLLSAPHEPWQLSRYSRLIDAGPPSSKFNDADGSKNDIGVRGCAEFK